MTKPGVKSKINHQILIVPVSQVNMCTEYVERCMYRKLWDECSFSSGWLMFWIPCWSYLDRHVTSNFSQASTCVLLFWYIFCKPLFFFTLHDFLPICLPWFRVRGEFSAKLSSNYAPPCICLAPFDGCRSRDIIFFLANASDSKNTLDFLPFTVTEHQIPESDNICSRFLYSLSCVAFVFVGKLKVHPLSRWLLERTTFGGAHVPSITVCMHDAKTTQQPTQYDPIY